MRRFNVSVYGDNAEELELKALTQAREVFGVSVGLLIDRSYGIFENSVYLSKDNLEAQTTRFHASIDVHPDEPTTGNEWFPGALEGYSYDKWASKYLNLVRP